MMPEYAAKAVDGRCLHLEVNNMVLLGMRNVFKRPLHLFGFYLVLNGLERFFIEKIRVNYKYDWGFLHPTQAEIISSLLVLAGLGILIFYRKQASTKPA